MELTLFGRIIYLLFWVVYLIPFILITIILVFTSMAYGLILFLIAGDSDMSRDWLMDKMMIALEFPEKSCKYFTN